MYKHKMSKYTSFDGKFSDCDTGISCVIEDCERTTKKI